VKTLELVRTGRIRNCALVMRQELLPGFQAQLPASPRVFDTTQDSRNRLSQEIGTLLLGKRTWGMPKSISLSDSLYLDTPYVRLYTQKN